MITYANRYSQGLARCVFSYPHIPDVGRPIRITSLQSVVVGVFSNTDILRLDFSVEYSATLLEEDADPYVFDL